MEFPAEGGSNSINSCYLMIMGNNWNNCIVGLCSSPEWCVGVLSSCWGWLHWISVAFVTHVLDLIWCPRAKRDRRSNTHRGPWFSYPHHSVLSVSPFLLRRGLLSVVNSPASSCRMLMLLLVFKGYIIIYSNNVNWVICRCWVDDEGMSEWQITNQTKYPSVPLLSVCLCLLEVPNWGRCGWMLTNARICE